MKSLNLRAEPAIFAAPLAGISEPAYRSIVSRMGADYTFTEMISSEGLIRGHKRTTDMLRKYPGEVAVGCQLFGTRPEVFAEAAQLVEAEGLASVDINCGCPVHKVVNKCGGAALLKDTALLEKIISTTVKKIKIPLSIKIRSGWNSDLLNYLEVGKIAEGAGAAFITIHARTQKELFRPTVCCEHIRELKENLSIPVVGNGGIKVAEDAVEMVRQTGCDGVMVASATLGNPFIFREIKSLLVDGKKYPPPDNHERIMICLEHIRKIVEYWGEPRGIKRSRKLLGWYYRHLTGKSRIDPELFKVNTYAEVERYLIRYLDSTREDAA